MLTEETAAQYRQSWEVTSFLSEQAAWPNVTRKKMYSHVASNKCATYVYRTPEGQIEAAAVLNVKGMPWQPACWIHFILMDNEAQDQSQRKTPRPVPAFMEAVCRKTMWDKLVLQVHGDNDHARQRFAQRYGFEKDHEYDVPKHHLEGMSMVPEGKEVAEARAKRRNEYRKRRLSADSSDLEVGMHKKRPRRAAAKEVNYAEPEDPGVTLSDILPGKYIYPDS